jgi:hypothetical protein
MSGQLFAAIRRGKVKPGMAEEFAKRVKAGALPVMQKRARNFLALSRIIRCLGNEFWTLLEELLSGGSHEKISFNQHGCCGGYNGSNDQERRHVAREEN